MPFRDSAVAAHGSLVGIDLDQRLLGGELAFDGSRAARHVGCAIPSRRERHVGGSPHDLRRRRRGMDAARRCLEHDRDPQRGLCRRTVVRSEDSFGASRPRVCSAAGTSAMPIGLSMTYGRANRDAAPFERFALGGGPSTLVDGALLSQRLSHAGPSGRDQHRIGGPHVSRGDDVAANVVVLVGGQHDERYRALRDLESSDRPRMVAVGSGDSRSRYAGRPRTARDRRVARCAVSKARARVYDFDPESVTRRPHAGLNDDCVDTATDRESGG